MNHPQAYFTKVIPYTLSTVPSCNHGSWAYDIEMFVVMYKVS